MEAKLPINSLPIDELGEGAGWLPLSWLPWIPARSAQIMLGSTLSKAPSPSSSIGDEFNYKYRTIVCSFLIPNVRVRYQIKQLCHSRFPEVSIRVNVTHIFLFHLSNKS